MKLKDFDINQKTYNKISNNIKMLCKPYLTQINNDIKAYPLFRGLDTFQDLVVTLPGYRNDRYPKDTPIHLHDAINRVFKTRFGVPFRNGTFATGNLHEADTYGPLYVVIPIGEFKFIWSTQIVDLYDYLGRKANDIANNFFSLKRADPKTMGIMLQYVTSSEFINLYQDTNLKQAIRSDHEVMLYCEQCYYIKMQIYEEISDTWDKSDLSI